MDAQLFSESNCRYVVEVAPENYDSFAKLMLNLPFGQIGNVTEEDKLVVKADNGKKVIDLELGILKQAWQKTFSWKQGLTTEHREGNQKGKRCSR